MKQVLLGAFAVIVALAGSAAGQSGATEVRGHLVDAVCAGNHAHEAGYAEKHENSCNLMDGCIKSGFSVITADRTVVKLDKAGNEQALALVKSIKKDRDIQVVATGKAQDGVFAVQSLKLK